jgi:hypothetical protein
MLKRSFSILLCSFLIVSLGLSQFKDDFLGDSISLDASAVKGWTFTSGEGSAVMEFASSGTGYATIIVDATKDKRNVWWALIRRCVSGSMNVGLLTKSENALRIEARIRVSHAPRRINLHLNTQRTTNFHTHLMEFDIPDTSNWCTVSMTTHNFDAHKGDTVYGQLALMDWGLEKYRVDIDYFKVDIVNTDSTGSDQGVQVPYHPHVPNLRTFAYHIPVAQDGMIDVEYPDLNFNNWSTQDNSQKKQYVLTINSTQYVILRWDLMKFAGKKVVGSGLLELTTYSLQRSPEYMKDFGMVRVTEIIGGDPQWNQNEVTYSSFCKGQSLNSVLNSQMIIDIEVSEKRGGRNLITIPNPVLQRMIDGKTLGLALRPLGVVNASFYAMENQNGKFSAQLHFNLNSESLIPVQLDH